MPLHEIKATVILPYRALVRPCGVALRIPPDSWDTEFGLSYARKYPATSSHSISTSICTIVNIETQIQSEADQAEFRKWLEGNLHHVMRNEIIPRLNQFLLSLKFTVQMAPDELPNTFVTGVIRSVGLIDLVLARIEFQGKPLASSISSSTFWQSGRGFAPKSLPAPLDLKGKIPPQEWSVLVRAVDLVNRGYFLEGFVVGFALLDAKLQEFIEANIPKARLRKIEGDRLVTFVGPLTKSILFASPLDDPAVSDDLAWLNRTRNEIMHAGRTCNRDEALRGLRVVLELLRFYRDKGSHYILPEQLDFY